MPIRTIKKGFTIIEVLIAFIIISVVSLSLISMQSSFSKSTHSRTVTTALSDVAQSAMATCQSFNTPPNSVYYNIPSINSDSSGTKKIEIFITVTGSCVLPAPNSCSDITIVTSNTQTITASSRKFTLEGNICNFN
jgi:prepilin-type N-terminal cleavage/methylation domain-containing protein